MSSCTLNSREAVDLLTERSDESLWYDTWLILLLSLKVAERFVTLTNLMHYLHVLSLRHVLSPRGDKSCRKVHLLHDLSPLRQQHYHLSLLFLWCVCVCVNVSVGACTCLWVRACVFLCMWGAGIVQWLERQSRDWKVAGSNPCRSGGRIFFSGVNFLCWLLFQYPFHPRVTAVARKRSRSFCQKCRWQVTAKHAYTLRMWLCMKWHGAWLYGVHRICADTL